VHVKVGDIVQEGQLLAQMYTARAAQVASADAAIQSAAAAIDKINAKSLTRC
jgi:multidrug efflux pump subunit AcrA (membrane-fusion protein)